MERVDVNFRSELLNIQAEITAFISSAWTSCKVHYVEKIFWMEPLFIFHSINSLWLCVNHRTNQTFIYYDWKMLLSRNDLYCSYNDLCYDIIYIHRYRFTVIYRQKRIIIYFPLAISEPNCNCFPFCKGHFISKSEFQLSLKFIAFHII